MRLWHCALFHLTLECGSSTLLSLATGCPGTTAFIIEILSCQVALHTCQEGLKGTAPAPLLCCSAWFFIALHRGLLRGCFQPYVNIIHFLMWQLRTARHCGAHYFAKPCLHSRGLQLTAPLSPLYFSVTLLWVILFIKKKKKKKREEKAFRGQFIWGEEKTRALTSCEARARRVRSRENDNIFTNELSQA